MGLWPVRPTTNRGADSLHGGGFASALSENEELTKH